MSLNTLTEVIVLGQVNAQVLKYGKVHIGGMVYRTPKMGNLIMFGQKSRVEH